MRSLIIFSFCVIGLSAQSYLIQNFFSELINNCNARTNSLHYPLINLIRDRFWNTANEFPKFSTSFYQARGQLGDKGTKIFTSIDSTINSCYNTMANDMNDYYIRQDFKSILDTMTEGFVNVRQNAINDFKKVIDKNVKKMSCFDQEKEAIRFVVDGFFNKTNDVVRDQIALLDEEIQDTQSDLIIFRITLESEVKSCSKNLTCVSNYVCFFFVSNHQIKRFINFSSTITLVTL